MPIASACPFLWQLCLLSTPLLNPQRFTPVARPLTRNKMDNPRFPGLEPIMADVAPQTPEIPSARFDILIQLLSSQAILALGLIPDPQGKTEVRLPLARHFIDLLAILESKTKGNLDSNEAKMLERSLHELRVLFLDQSQGG